MENEIITIGGMETYLDENGTAWLKLEKVARGLGFTHFATSGNEVVRWDRVSKYLADFGVPNYGHDDFIPENVFYRLCMKAKNKKAEKFQTWVADEVIPSIRKHGMYIDNKALNDADFTLQVIAKLKEEIEKNRLLSETCKKLDARLKMLEEKDARNIEIDVTNEQASQIEDFVSAYMEDKTDITLTELHKILKQSNLTKVGRNEFCSWLRMNGYLGNSKEDNTYNVPTALSIDKELFTTKEYSYFNYYTHEKTVCINPRVTAVGLDFFMRVFLTIKNHKKDTIREVTK